jgi:hypothetical protein
MVGAKPGRPSLFLFVFQLQPPSIASKTGTLLRLFPDALVDVFCYDLARSKRSRFMTLFHAATKSWTNFSCESSLP